MIASNIFVPRNDWQVKSLMCKRSKIITSNDIIRFLAVEVEREIGISPFGDYRYQGRDFVLARQMYMTLLCKHTTWGLRKIGQTVGKDHSTVVYAKRMISDLCDTDPVIKDIYDKIDKRMSESNFSKTIKLC